MSRALLHYLAQAWMADRYRQAQRHAPTRAASDVGHPRPSRRARRVRGLPAVVERVRTAPGGAR
jgi:hypothetical protein